MFVFQLLGAFFKNTFLADTCSIKTEIGKSRELLVTQQEALVTFKLSSSDVTCFTVLTDVYHAALNN